MQLMVHQNLHEHNGETLVSQLQKNNYMLPGIHCQKANNIFHSKNATKYF